MQLRRRSEKGDREPDHADGRAAHHKTRDALACAREHIQEFLAELVILFGGKAGADGGTASCGGWFRRWHSLRGLERDGPTCGLAASAFLNMGDLQLRGELNTTNSSQW